MKSEKLVSSFQFRVSRGELEIVSLALKRPYGRLYKNLVKRKFTYACACARLTLRIRILA